MYIYRHHPGGRLELSGSYKSEYKFPVQLVVTDKLWTWDLGSEQQLYSYTQQADSLIVDPGGGYQPFRWKIDSLSEHYLRIKWQFKTDTSTKVNYWHFSR